MRAVAHACQTASGSMGIVLLPARGELLREQSHLVLTSVFRDKYGMGHFLLIRQATGASLRQCHRLC